MKPRQEFFPNAYYTKHGIKDFWCLSETKDTLDETSSYILTGKKKNKKVRYLAPNSNTGYSYPIFRYYWTGWLSRLERVQALADRLHKRANDYSEHILMPEMEKWVGKRLHYWNPNATNPKMGWISTIDVEKCSRHRFYPDEEDSHEKYLISWSTGSLQGGEISIGGLAQYSYWNEGSYVKTLIDRSHTLRAREQVVRGYLSRFIHMKLDVIEKQHKIGSIIEFKIGNTPFRFERVSRTQRDNAYGAWKAIPTSTIKNVDISTILSKEFYL